MTLHAVSSSTDDYVLEHTYGYEGERVKTTYDSNAKTDFPDLEDELRFGPGLVVRGSTLEVVLSMGDRPLGRLEMPVSGSGGPCSTRTERLARDPRSSRSTMVHSRKGGGTRRSARSLKA